MFLKELLPPSSCSLVVKMEVAGLSETLASLYQTKWCHFPEVMAMRRTSSLTKSKLDFTGSEQN
jgi:hypothetical protein